MSDPVAFGTARLDEDEALALAAQVGQPGTWHATGEDILTVNPDPHWNGVCVANASGAEAAHIVRHDPARVLREVAAKRAILTEHKPAWRDVEWPHDENGKGEAQVCPRCQNAEHGTLEDPGVLPEGFVTSYVLAPCPTLLALLSVYGDHPDYDQEWKP
jgi:hypothetical protein